MYMKEDYIIVRAVTDSRGSSSFSSSRPISVVVAVVKAVAIRLTIVLYWQYQMSEAVAV